MNPIKVYTSAGEAAGEVAIDEATLTLDKGAQAVKDTIVAIQAGMRAGTASTLSKGEVAGSNKKPWKQKGTGRARVGLRQNPVWRGGGVAFGPKPRDYGMKVNTKVKQLAFNRVFSDVLAEGRVQIVEKFDLPGHKTKDFAALLKKLGLEGKSTLVIVDKLGEESVNLVLAMSNLPKVDIAQACDADLYTLMRYRQWVATKAGFEALQARMAKRAVKKEVAK